MKRKLIVPVVVTLLMFSWDVVFACTAIFVGREATVDGSVLVSHANDAFRDSRLVLVPSGDHKPGEMRPVYYDQPSLGYLPQYGGERYRIYIGKSRGPVYDTGESVSLPIGYIPQVAHTYAYFESVYPIMNEHQLSVGETTCQAKIVPEPKKGKRLFYSASLARVALERCKKAREAVELMGSLIDRYGYYGTGEALIVADSREGWLMEMCGYEEDGVGGLWVSKRIPDDCVCVSANQFRIREVKPGAKDMLYSANLFDVCREKGWWDPKDGPLDWLEAVSTSEYRHPYYSQRRVWRVFDLAKPSAKFSPWTDGPFSKAYPFAVKPDKKLGVSDVLALHRDYYQGTEFDLTKGMAAGAYGNPMRYDCPSGAEANVPETCGNVRGAWERSISVYRCVYYHVNQLRANLPDPVGGLIWFGFDNPAAGCVIPVYASVTKLPESFGRGTYIRYDPQSAWWTFNFLSNYATRKYSYMIQDIQQLQQKIEEEQRGSQPMIEKISTRLLEDGKETQAREYLTQYCITAADSVLRKWCNLTSDLIVKYNDGYLVEPNGATKKLGYPEKWLKNVGYQDGPLSYQKPDQTTPSPEANSKKDK